MLCKEGVQYCPYSLRWYIDLKCAGTDYLIPHALSGWILPLGIGFGCIGEGFVLSVQVLRIEEAEEKKNTEAEAIFDKRLALRGLRVVDLMKLAREHNVKGRSKMRKADLVAHLEGASGIMKKLQKIKAPS